MLVPLICSVSSMSPGAHCFKPPTPPAQHQLSLDSSYTDLQPTRIGLCSLPTTTITPPFNHRTSTLVQPYNEPYPGSSVTYHCSTTAIEGQIHHNKREDDFSSNTYTLTCLPDDTWDTPQWPTCSPSMSLLASLASFTYSLPQ